MKCFVVFLAVFACAKADPQYITNLGALPYATSTLGLHGPAPITYTAAGPAAITYAAAPVTYAAAAPAVIAPAFTKTQYHAQDELGQASYGHAEPGQAHAAVRDAAGNVQGSYAYVNPDGNQIRVDYTAGHNGFQVASNALPVAPPHVLDTPEVVQAKAEHFQEVENARARNAAADLADATEGVVHSRKKRGVLSTAYAAPAITYASPYTYRYATAALPLTYATSYSYRYDAPRIVAPTVVRTIAPAPIVKTYAVAPAPIVKTIAPAPIVRAIAPAPIIRTYAAPAPIVKTYAVAPAPIVKTYAAAPIVKNYAAAPVVRTYAYAPYSYSYGPSFYSAGYSPYYGYANTYGYSKFLG